MKTRLILFLFVLLMAGSVSACAAPAAAPAPAASGPVQVTLVTSPNPAISAGDTELVIEVKDGAGQPVSGATVQVSVDMLSHSMGAMEGQATDQGSGRYATKVPFGMAGDWVVAIEVRQGDAIVATQEVTLPVLPAAGAPTGSAQPRLVVDQDRIDFGSVPVNQVVRASFKVTNSGAAPLTLAVPPVARVVEGC